MSRFFTLVILTSVLLLSACEPLSWYSQAGRGQLAIQFSGEEISTLLESEETSQRLKQQLVLLERLVAFAENELQLPADGNFSEYVDLGREYPVWNVYAAEQFSVAPRKWCYFIVGCMSYRGYFTKQAAEKKTNELKQQGLDAFFHGVAAYSTLGWFEDPVLSSFIYRDEAELASLVFHELAHKKLYIENDTRFNESFAEAVAEEGLRRWYAAKNNIEAFRDYQKRQQRQQAFNRLLLNYREQLSGLYAEQDISNEEKLSKKENFYSMLLEEYQTFRNEWQYSGYDRWMYNDLNNAKLAIIADYHQWVPAFRQELLLHHDRSLKEFYQWVKVLAQQEADVRHGRLRDRLVEPSGLTDV